MSAIMCCTVCDILRNKTARFDPIRRIRPTDPGRAHRFQNKPSDPS